MSALSDYGEKLILDWLMTTGSATRPTAWYLALYTAAPADAGGGTEVSGNGYARQVVTMAAATSPGGTTTSTDAQAFAAAGGNWGTITHVGLFDALTTGNLLWHGTITTNRVMNDGDTLTFAIADLDLTLG
tara:strand:+ start:250 stop:642 length:393 start_codon:yes stop_codon:yes gene_type:complete